MTSTRSSLESERLAIRLDNMPDRPDEITHCHLVKYPNWPGRQIQLHLFNGNDVFALCHTVDRETKLSCPKGHTIRQVTSRSIPNGRADHRENIPPAVQIFARDHDDTMRSSHVEISRVDFAGANHGISSIRPAALRSAIA